VKVGIVVFPGSNCDRDMHHVLNDVFKIKADFFWHEKTLPKNLDAVILPGGFSYGDRLRAGVIAANSPVISDIKKMANQGMPILGVCNGFQILVEAGLLPGVLLKNNSLSFMCKWTIANGEGRYYADEKTLATLKKNNQIVFRYEEVVNGSSLRIAGICNKEGNVVGMMPHPERAAEREINPIDNKPSSLIFESLQKTLSVAQ